MEELDAYLAGQDCLVKRVHVNSINMYIEIDRYNRQNNDMEVMINTKYKTIDRKVKPVVVPLPIGSEKKMEFASMEPVLRSKEKIGHHFTPEALKKIKRETTYYKRKNQCSMR